MNKTADKNIVAVERKFPEVEYDDEAVELIQAEGLQSELDVALKRLPDCFPSAVRIKFEVLESGDEDSEPSLVMFVFSPMTSQQSRIAVDNFMEPFIRQSVSKLFLFLAVLPRRE